MAQSIQYPRYLLRERLALSILSRYFKEHEYVPKRFLEIGAGRGDFASILSSLVPHGTVMDFSPEAVEILHNRFRGTGIDVLEGDFQDTKVSGSYDLVVILEVLEHIPDDSRVLEKINGILPTRGLILISVPARMKRWSASDDVTGHLRRYQKKDLQSQLKHHGFEIRNFISYGFPVLNIVASYRNRFFQNQRKYKERDMASRSKVSGMGYSSDTRNTWLWALASKLLFFRGAVWFYTKAFSPFHRFDLGDGYLCLATKVADYP